jgi:hypothetical protein
MLSRTKILLSAGALTLISIALAVTTSGLLSSQQVVPAGGKISYSVGVEVYDDPTAAKLCSYIDWGAIAEDKTVTRTIYVKNTGNATETLSMRVSDWEPALAGELLRLSWDREGALLEPGDMVAASLTLVTPRDAGSLESFGFNVVIEGSS